MEKARYNTELCSNLSQPLNNVKPSNFWGSHHSRGAFILSICYEMITLSMIGVW